MPGPEQHFLINPYGLMFDEITASNLVKIDLDGTPPIDPTGYPVNPAGYVIHSAIHGAREDAQCVLHTHTSDGFAVAAPSAGCCRSPSSPSSSPAEWPTTITKAWRWT